MLCYQEMGDLVKYITSDMEHSGLMNYYKFLEWIYPFRIFNFEGFKEELNKFLSLYVDFEKLTWEIYEVPKDAATFEELLALNSDSEKPSKVDKLKTFVTKFSKIKGHHVKRNQFRK